MIRLVMSDLDGTLLTDDKQVSEPTIKAIQALREKGILFGIATGRSLVAVERLVHTWGIAEYCDVMLGMNGSQFMDTKTGEIQVSHQLPGAVIQEVIDQYRHLNVNFAVYEENTLFALRDEGIARKLAAANQFQLVVTDYSDVVTRPHSKVLILVEPDYMSTVEDFAAANPSESFRGFKSDKYLFEIVDPNVSKSFGIQRVCDHFGFTMKEVMAFGDNNNDIEMIRDVGIGVCMANGTALAKDVASAIALSNQEDGLAQFIMSYLAKAAVEA